MDWMEGSPSSPVKGQPTEDWLAHREADATFFRRDDRRAACGVQVVTAIVQDLGLTLLIDARGQVLARSGGHEVTPGGLAAAPRAVRAPLRAGRWPGD